MIPGPDRVIACPHCMGLGSYGTLRSGNTFGAETWTDGKQVAPMLPEPPQVVRCPHCSRFYWLADARRLGEIAPLGEPDAGEYHRALHAEVARNAREWRTLRILAWWRWNDDFRDTSGRPASRPWLIPAEAKENLEALIPLLDDADESDRVMKAEALRELGRFDEAMSVLSTVTSPELARVVSRLRTLCEGADARLRVLWPEATRT